MLTGVTVRIRLLVLALLPLTMLVTVIAMALANASRLDASFQDLFNNRMKPISQLKIVADAVAVSVVDALHKYRAGVFDEERLQQELSGALSRIEKSWADYSADHRTAAEKEIIESLVPTLERVKRMTWHTASRPGPEACETSRPARSIARCMVRSIRWEPRCRR